MRIANSMRGFGLAAIVLFTAHTVSAEPAEILLPEDTPFPESITSTKDGTLYVSSISDGGVLRIRPGEEPHMWIEPGAYETRSTFGVLADEKEGVLWLCSNDASAIGIKGPGDVEGSFLKKFDLKTGEYKASYQLPNTPAVCNDIAIDADGGVYATNVAAPEIVKLEPGAEELTVWLADPALKGGLDGLAFGEDGNLYVNTIKSGEFFRVDVEDGKAKGFTKLETSRELVEPDALKPIPGGFVMAEGGGTLDRVTVEGDKAKIETLADFKGPTGVTVVGDTVWVAEGQLAYLLDEKKKNEPRPDFYLRSMPLPKAE